MEGKLKEYTSGLWMYEGNINDLKNKRSRTSMQMSVITFNSDEVNKFIEAKGIENANKGFGDYDLAQYKNLLTKSQFSYQAYNAKGEKAAH
jgi:hypothetical protein